MGGIRENTSQLYLTNTLTKKKEPFISREGKKVKMFTCGPSIYRRSHLGNYRTFLYEDILQRYLEYCGYHVERIINFTDVEDKSLKAANQQGITFKELTEPIALKFLEEAELLRIKLPPYIPRSSTSVDQAVNLIKILLEKGYAYRHDKDVYYDPLKFTGFGKLFGLDMSLWPKRKKRFRKDTYPGKRWNLGDFILWRGCKKGENGDCLWDTEIGRGRPAWNIQDPAMITKHLGFKADIVCGGVDNLYRHHDYIIAVIEAVSGEEFAHYWLHGEHVLINGAKMSKSKGNIVYLEDLLRKGYSATYLRFLLIYGRYRKKMNLTEKIMGKVKEKFDALLAAATFVTADDGSHNHANKNNNSTEELIPRLVQSFESHMNNDLDVKGAIDALNENLSELSECRNKNRLGHDDRIKIRKTLERVDEVLKIFTPG